jgi:hypothetical protein
MVIACYENELDDFSLSTKLAYLKAKKMEEIQQIGD